MKKLTIFLTTLTLFIGILSCSALAEEVDVPIYVDGKKIEFDVMPQITDGRTRVPMRKIFEALGARVTWDDESKTATAKRGNITVKITAMENALYKNDEKIELDVPAEIIDGRTVVPLRAVSEAFDTEVSFYEDIKTIYIESDPSKTELIVLYNLNRDPDLVPVILKDAFLGAGWLENVESESLKKGVTFKKGDMLVYSEYPNVLSIDNMFPGLYCSQDRKVYSNGINNKPDYEYRFEAKTRSHGEQYSELYAAFLESEGYTLICKMLNPMTKYFPTMIYELVAPDEKNLIEIFVSKQSNEKLYHVRVRISDYTGESKYAYEEGYFNPQYRTALYALDGRTVIVPKEDTERYLTDGWYEEPMMQLYTPDETIVVKSVYAQDYVNVGWYTEPVRVLYAPGGKSYVCTEAQVPAQLGVGWYTEPVEAVYNQAGEQLVVYSHEVEAYRAVGWFSEEEYAVVEMYNQNDDVVKVHQYQVEDYKAAGWFTYDEPVEVVYSYDGSGLYVRAEEVEFYREAGWFTADADVTAMYASDGRTIYVKTEEVEKYKAVGWHDNIEDVAKLMYNVRGPGYVLFSDVEKALANGCREYSYPVIYTENAAFSIDSAGGIDLYWSPQNISGKTIIAYEIEVYYLGRDGEFLTDVYGNPIRRKCSFTGPIYPDEALDIKTSAGYVNRCEKLVIGEIFLRFYDRTTDNYWLGQIVEREFFE